MVDPDSYESLPPGRNLALVDDAPDQSLVERFLNRYVMRNGCLRERDGNYCVCNSLDAILWAEIAAPEQLRYFAEWARLMYEQRVPSAIVDAVAQHQALFIWWCAIDWEPKISPHQAPDFV